MPWNGPTTLTTIPKRERRKSGTVSKRVEVPSTGRSISTMPARDPDAVAKAVAEHICLQLRQSHDASSWNMDSTLSLREVDRRFGWDFKRLRRSLRSVRESMLLP